jgi:hypothetical protein
MSLTVEDFPGVLVGYAQGISDNVKSRSTRSRSRYYLSSSHSDAQVHIHFSDRGPFRSKALLGLAAPGAPQHLTLSPAVVALLDIAGETNPIDAMPASYSGVGRHSHYPTSLSDTMPLR